LPALTRLRGGIIPGRHVEEIEMELRQYARILWKWSWLIVLAAAVAGV
jgi:uncharacterized protein involved in exopolysaccharide biosynthesis